MEIPTALIHRLQSSLREAAATSSSSPPPQPPFLSVTDAVAAFDSSSASPSPELRCERCGGAGGLVRGVRSAACTYCGFARREESGGVGVGVAFGATAACGWLLGSLGLDGSEPVNLDTEPMNSSKGKEMPKSGMVLSDLLDLKLSWPPENKETSECSKNKEQPSVTYALNLSGVDLDSFLTEAKKERSPSAAIPCNDPAVQKKESSNSTNHGNSSSETYAPSEGFYSSGMKISSPSSNNIESTPEFANWDADFQSAGSQNVVTDSKQVDLFQISSVAESFSLPTAGTTINQGVDMENETKIKSTGLELSEDFGKPLASDKLVQDDLFNKNDAQPVSGSDERGITGISSGELSRSSLIKNSVQGDPWPVSGNTGNSTDEAFDDWQEFTAVGGNQGNLSNSREQAEGPLFSDPSGIKTVDSWPVSSLETSDDVKARDDNGDSFDDWQAFATCSGQAQGGLMKPVDETASISFEHSSLTKSVDLWPIGNLNESNNTEMVNENSDSFNDWRDFASSDQAQGTSSNPVGDVMGISHASPTEIESMNSWFTGSIKKSSNTELVNGNNDSFDDWQGFTSSGQAQQNSSKLGGEMMNLSFEHHKGIESTDSWLTSNSKESGSTESANRENNSFDIWQDFTTSGQPQENSSNLGGEMTSISSEHPKEINSMDLWLTSNFKESKSTEVVNGNNDSSDDWQGFSSSGQAQGNLSIPGEGQTNLSIKDALKTEPLDLWASRSAKEFKNLEQMNENNDSFDDWQDFTSSSPPEKSLPTSSDASLFDYRSASKPDILLGVEFGSFAQSTSSQKLVAGKESSNEANNIPSHSHLDRMNGMQQMTEVDSLSTIWATTSLDHNSTLKQDPVNANVEKLLSQMHDLSFMLKDELSVPNKPMDLHSKC